MSPIDDPRALLRALFDAAVTAALPGAGVVGRFLPPPPKGRTLVVGAGKGAAAMAKAVEDVWQAPLSGLVVTRYGHGCPTRNIEVIEAGHPNPDGASQAAAQRILSMAGELTADDLLLCLISGGGSALMALPAPGLTLDDKKMVTRELLRCGAAIDEMNIVRKHLSAIKGGRLAGAAWPAPATTLMISDVPGDDPSIIASGPTVPDPSTFADARAVVAKYGIAVPAAVRRHLDAGAEESPKPGDARLGKAQAVLIATPQNSLEAAAAAARAAGVTPLILGNSIEGEAREVARVMAAMARQAADHGQPAAGPCVLLSGGETTVTVHGNGRGGRNAEFLLALAVALDGHDKVWAIACDTDGIDGTEDNAGALLGPDSLARAAAKGLDAKARLADNDGYGFFAGLGDLVVTGPTRTNVNDFRAILILP
ncbi:glycerate kinase type-2 family protein [Magnetospirillum sulfuroxidans]|uniref:Glycerate kinase n=1 Tax=Magnetospirillum sulfuroxidans TaxID=611300 RepID=A0ABS5I9D7_9PROT|nr:glycerate kinase [Magnetospirillum sulfuroxidans]MBR9971050.1 glycerate kinase [Magnetospirillum sulfuroxidans]